MKLLFPLSCLCLGVISFGACKKEVAHVSTPDNPAYLHQSVKRITNTIIHDIFSPPVASRIYSYSSVAAYEVAAQADSTDEYRSLAGKLRDLKEPPAPPAQGTWDATLASTHAMLTVGKALIFSEDTLAAFQNQLYQQMLTDRKIDRDVYENSMNYGKQVADHIIAWSAGDNYKQSRTFPKYSITSDPSKWQPTPPAYMDGIEPHWGKIRPFVLDSASQFAPPPPTEFSTDTTSLFYREAMEVYMACDTTTEGYEENIAIASFWDCNPYVSHHVGHVMFATKKITPGGHWMGITAQACRKGNLDLAATARAYALVAITLCDGFISCWDEKYRSNLVRPETYINNYIDANWRPTLQTPPFPEYTSGHSVISGAAAVVLTELIGDNIAYTDSVELEYGLPMRNFTSFSNACDEAAMSRMYGGIHYRPAIVHGLEQGKKVGKHVIEQVVKQ